MALSVMAEAWLAELPFHWLERKAAYKVAQANTGLTPRQSAQVSNAVERSGRIELREAGKETVEFRTRRGRFERLVTRWEIRRTESQ